jgi:hypothetical protein
MFSVNSRFTKKRKMKKAIFFRRFIAFYALAMIFSLTSMYAQYYKATRKNVVFLAGNIFTDKNAPLLNPTLEFGKIKNEFLLFHAGAGARNRFEEPKQVRGEVVGSKNLVTDYFAVAGADIYFFQYCLLNLSRKNYCKYLINSVNFGFDLTKDLRGNLTSGFGYRAKAYLSFFIERTGSYKKDIGGRREIHLGYCFTDTQINSKQNNGIHSLSVGFLLMKRKLIKFADWY